jgi:hypothetical protein
MSAKFDIPKFDDKISFAIWHIQMKVVLTQLVVRKSLQIRPADMTDDKWQDIDERALSAIQLILSFDVLHEVMHEKSVATLWKKLEELYMTNSLANKLHLKERLYTICMLEGTSMQSHLNEFNSIIVNLESLDVKIDDEDKAILLVVSLPPSFKHFKEIMLYGNHTSLSFENVKSNLLSKEKFDVDSRSEPKCECLIVQGSRDHKSNLYCRYCRKNTHHISQCPKVRNKEERNKNELDKSSVKPVLLKLWIVEKLCLLSLLRSALLGFSIPLALFIFVRIEIGFFYFVQSHASEVVIGDGSTCEIIGIDSIYIQVHDGSIKKLIDVRFVPKLKRNLFSLNTLEAMGFNFAAIDGVLKVSRGNRIILKGNHLNNLCYLQCSIVDAEVVFIVLQKRGYFDDTKSCSSSKSNVSLDLVDIQI